jgi:NitT/TauT family transport system substrate-binding protein
MMAAFAESLRDAIDHPDEAFTLSQKYVEGLSDPAVARTQRQVLDATIALWRADRPGQSDLADWARMQDVLVRMSLLDSPQDLSAAFTNAFVP